MIIFFWNNFLNSRDHWFVPLIHSSIDFLKNIVMHNSSTRKEMLRYFIEEDWMWDGKIFFSSMIRRVFLNLLMYCNHRQCKSQWTSKTVPHVFFFILFICFLPMWMTSFLYFFCYYMTVHISLPVLLLQFQYNFVSFPQYFLDFISLYFGLHERLVCVHSVMPVPLWLLPSASLVWIQWSTNFCLVN